MEIDLEKLEVVQNEAENRFELRIGEYLSKLDYMQDGRTFVITHVGVHPELRGHGVAGRLTQVGLDYARARSLRVIPMCSYAATYIRRHPQYLDLTKYKADQ